jgi:predicted ATPase
MPSTNNLPVQLNNFVGRDREKAEVERLLTNSHLVTLTGPGGVGKTRLALQVAYGMVTSFKDGICFIELAALAEPRLVVQGVAQVLNVKEVPGQPLLAALTNFCFSRRLLLILDNCEHLLDATAGLAQHLLLNCPDLRLLVTSREQLNIPGETVKLIEPLDLPDPRNLPALDQLQKYPAIKLFSDRALLTQPQFKLTEHNAMAVARICYQLDGLPLALELAAVRLRSLTAEQIAIRLRDTLGLLSQGVRTALPRQQSLNALIDWSYSLLCEKEKKLFERLTVFVRDWSLEAAEVVCAGEEIETFEVLDLLSQLVNKSLVVMVERQGTARYHFLESIRQFALEKLAKTGMAPAVNHRLLAWALQLGSEAGGQI